MSSGSPWILCLALTVLACCQRGRCTIECASSTSFLLQSSKLLTSFSSFSVFFSSSSSSSFGISILILLHIEIRSRIEHEGGEKLESYQRISRASEIDKRIVHTPRVEDEPFCEFERASRIARAISRKNSSCWRPSSVAAPSLLETLSC